MEPIVAVAAIWIIGIFMVGRVEPLGHRRKPQPKPSSKLARMLEEFLK